MSVSTGRGANCPGIIPTVSGGIWRVTFMVLLIPNCRFQKKQKLANSQQHPGNQPKRLGKPRLISPMAAGDRTAILPTIRPGRHPFSHVTLDDVRNSTVQIQENNIDTIIALAQRTFGSAYQFVPPMSVTLGVKECLSAKKVRLFSDTGAWKQTALRVALFGPLTPEYPITLCRSILMPCLPPQSQLLHTR